MQKESLSLLISRINGLSAEWAQKQGINPYQTKPLYALYLDPSMTQKQIGESCALPKQTVSNAIRKLKTDGYVTLEASSNDRREKYIRITDTGKEYLEKVSAPIADLENRVIAGMGKEAYESLIFGLNRYAEVMEKEMKK